MLDVRQQLTPPHARVSNVPRHHRRRILTTTQGLPNAFRRFRLRDTASDATDPSIRTGRAKTQQKGGFCCVVYGVIAVKAIVERMHKGKPLD